MAADQEFWWWLFCNPFLPGRTARRSSSPSQRPAARVGCATARKGYIARIRNLKVLDLQPDLRQQGSNSQIDIVKMLPKTFSVRSLQRNLNFGLGAGVKLPGVKRIDVTFGKDTCPAKAALSSLYVNELPRLHVANPTISFRTLAEEPTSHLSILLENEKQITINLHELRSSKEMYRRLIDISQPPSDAGTAAPIVE